MQPAASRGAVGVEQLEVKCHGLTLADFRIEKNARHIAPTWRAFRHRAPQLAAAEGLAPPIARRAIIFALFTFFLRRRATAARASAVAARRSSRLRDLFMPNSCPLANRETRAHNCHPWMTTSVATLRKSGRSW
jgi:hypothetical protein